METYGVKVYSSNTQWYQDGEFHRLDGPAVERADGTKYWYIEGVKLTESEFLARTKPCLGKEIEVDGVKYILS